MKKKLTLIILIGITCFIGVSSALAKTIIDSDHVTYDSPKTESDNVKAALDELIEKVDNLNSGGDATPNDITEGKTALVKGQLITGTRKNKPVYFNRVTNNDVYINGNKVTFRYDSVLAIQCSGLELTLGTDNDKNTYTVEKTFQINPSIVAVIFKRALLQTDNDTTTETRYYYYLNTYTISNNKLIKINSTDLAVCGGINDPTNYWDYVVDYSNGTASGDVVSHDAPTITRAIIPSIGDRQFITFKGGFQRDYWTNNELEKQVYGKWFHNVVINSVTGAAERGTVIRKTATDDSTVHNINKFGIEEKQYVSASDYSIKQYVFTDYYYTSANAHKTATVNVPTANYSLHKSIRDFTDYFKGGYSYLISPAFGFSNTNISINYKNVYMGEYGSAGNYFSNPVLSTKNKSYNVSDILPNSITITSLNSEYYVNGNYYVTYNCSKGKIYAIYSVSEDPANAIINIELDSVSYRESENGTLLSTEKNTYSNDVIRFYR